MKFVDSSGKPTERWQNYRNKSKSPEVLGEAIRDGYKELFNTYPDANRKDNEALRNYFAANTALADRAISAMLSTFKALCELASFDGDPASVKPEVKIQEVTPDPIAPPVVSRTTSTGTGVTININIEIGMPDSDKADTYDKFFAALKKHILKDD